MDQETYFSFLCLIILSSSLLSTEVHAGKIQFQQRKVKLFAFGDSYADTGNTPRSDSVSWKVPYGTTFPGKPSGRFSDGRVLTDYIASFLGIKCPTPYKRRDLNTPWIKNGINFAYGGTGVFNTLVHFPNMTTQIDLLQQLVTKNVYTRQNLSSSIALVSLAGNDYAAYLINGGSFQGLPEFCLSVVNRLIINIKRIKQLGIKRIVVSGMAPVGCLPRNTASDSFLKCNPTFNNLSQSHNSLLKQTLYGLNNHSASPVFVYLDLYDAFNSAMKLAQNTTGNWMNGPLKPCCIGANGEDCGLVGKDGEKKYAVCENPKQSFFWDLIHPTNEGWSAVYSALKPTLKSLVF